MWEKELKTALEAGRLAEKKIMEVYETGFDVQMKSDLSPVTEADKESDAIIRKYLNDKFPSYALLSEESFDDKDRLNNDYVWIIDPLDGTTDFIDGNGDFAINIALSYKHKIVVGVIVIPVTGTIYYATKNGGAHRLDKDGKDEIIHVNNKDENLTCLISRFHLKKEETDLIEKHKDKITSTCARGSSLKACSISEGTAEVSYRLSAGTKEWDIAPCVILVKEAGGVFLKPDFTEYEFNRDDVYNRQGYIIANKKENILL